MASIDERVVAMAFENAAFEQKVSVTMSTLTKLDVAIKNIGQTNGLSHIEADANKVTLSRLGSVIDKIKSKLNFNREAAEAFSGVESASNRVKMDGVNRAIDKTAGHFSVISQSAARVDISTVGRGVQAVTRQFSILEGAAAVALGSIASRAALTGAQAVKSLSLGPVVQGFQEYATNLNAIQTTLANTQQDGTHLNDVNAALSKLNTYSDQTIYNFSQMAKNIGTFTAAGVKLGPATESIKGIANLAALSGSNSEQASTAMYQLSQAIAAGKVNLQDWNSVVNAGMGGKVFQKALFDTGKAMGTITNSPVGQTFEQWEKAGNSFRQSLSATQKTAKDGTSALKKAQVEGAKAVADAHEQAAASIKAASESVTEAQKAEGEALKAAAIRVRDAQEQAAEDTKNAADKVVEAQHEVKDAAKQATRDISDAVHAQKEQTKQSAADVKGALDAVTEARRRLVEAMKPPSADELQAAADSLKTAQLDSADLADAVTEAQKEQTRSAEDLAEAQKRLEDLKTSGGSADDIRNATRAVEDAQKRVTDSADAVERAILRQNAATRGLHDAETDLQDVTKKGTDQDKEVVDSRDALTKATDDYRAAQRKARKDDIAAAQAVTDARKSATRAQREAGDRLAQAEKDQAKVQVKAREDVKKAEQDQRDTIIKARADVAKAETEYTKTVKDSREAEADATEQSAERIKSARESMTGKDSGPPSWLTSDVLTNTLRQFTGDMTDAQLKAQGFTDAQIKAIRQTAQTAKEAATQVKTVGQLFDVIKESIGSGWAKTFQIIFGDFGEAKKTFTALSNYITGFVSGMAKARNKILSDWKDLGGRTELIEGLKNAFKALMAIVKPIKDAFRDIFPRKTGEDLFELTKRFRDFMEQLKIGPETAEDLRRTFRGLFALFSIGKTIIGEILGVFFDLIGVVGEGSGGFLNFTGTIGDFLVAIDDALKKGKGLAGVFDTITAALSVPLEGLKIIIGYIGSLFGFGDSDAGANIGEQFNKLGEGSENLRKLIARMSTAWEGFMRILHRIYEFLTPFIDAIGEVLKELRQKVVDSLDFLTSEKGLNIAQTGLLAGIFAAVRKGLASINIGLPTDTLDHLNSSFKALTGTLTGLQSAVHAASIAAIAVAIALLAGSIVLISKVDAQALTRALTGIAVGLGELGAALIIFSKLSTGSIKFGPMAAAMVILAGAMVILAIAIRMLAKLDWVELAKGLAGVAGGMVAMGLGLDIIGPSVVATAPGILIVAFALNLLAAAMTQMATISWEGIAKGIVGVGASLAAMGLGMAFMAPFVTTMAPGVLAISVAMIFLAAAMKKFGDMSWKEIAKGLVAVGASLFAIGVGMHAMPLTLLPTAAGLLVVAIALQGVAAAVAIFGNMKMGTLAKGIIAMGASLLVLAIGLNAMIATLPGAVALLAAAAAFAVLVPMLALLGSLPVLVIVKGLIAMAAVLGVLALVGLVAAGPIAALGAALVPLGAALVLIAASIYVFAAALKLLSIVGTKGLVALGAVVVGIIALIPKLIKDFLIGLVDVLEAIVKLLPKIVVAVGLIIDAILDIVIRAAPKLAIAAGSLILAFLDVLNQSAKPLIDAGWKLLLNFLSGIETNLPKMVDTVGHLVVTFLTKMTEQMPLILAKGAGMLAAFLKGIVDNLPKVVARAAQVVVVFLAEITRRMPSVVAAGGKLIVTFLTEITKQVPKFAKAGTRLIVAVIDGIGNMLVDVIAAGVRVIKKLMNGIAKAVPELVDAGAKAIVRLLNGIADAIRNNSADIRKAGWNIIDAIIDGMLDGLRDLWHKVSGMLDDLIGKLPKAARKLLGIASPSKVFTEIGRRTMEGLVVGLSDGGAEAANVVEGVANDLVNTATEEFGKVPDILDGVLDLDPTIRPVLDLTQVQAEAKKMPTLDANVIPISAAASFNAASAISTDTAAVAQASADLAAQQPQEIKFEQNLTSPESLSEIEIYRQTNNLLSQAKRVLMPGTGA